MKRTLLIVALAAALLSISPMAAAGDGEEPPCPDPFALPCDALGRAVGNVVDTVERIVEDVQPTPSSSPIDLLEHTVCGDSEASQNNPQCRAVSGRPVTGGIFSLCERGPQHDTGFGMLVFNVASLADATVRSATTTAFAGTALEGESMCHDHWDTLRALATLP